MSNTSELLITLHRLLLNDEAIIRAIRELQNQPERSWYSPAEFGRLVKRSPFTVRKWCRTDRIEARKRPVGRGDKLEWEIPKGELERFRNHGLMSTTKSRCQLVG